MTFNSIDDEFAQTLANDAATRVTDVVVRIARDLNSLGLDALRRVLDERPELLNACRYCAEIDLAECGGGAPTSPTRGCLRTRAACVPRSQAMSSRSLWSVWTLRPSSARRLATSSCAH